MTQSLHEMNEEALLSKARNGEIGAINELMCRTSELVQKFVKRRAHLDDVDDILQTVWFQVFKKLDQFRGSSRFSTWVIEIAKNASNRQNKKRSHSPVLPLFDVDGETPPVFVDSISPLKLLIKKDEHNILKRALNCLSSTLQEVVRLYYFEELAYNEIAEKLSIPIGTVMSRLSRAKKELKGLLETMKE